MKRVFSFIRMKWDSLLLSVLLGLSIAYIAATNWFGLLKKIYSLKDLAFAASLIFILLIWLIWFVANNFLTWLKSKQINASQRDYLLLFIAILSMIATVYYGWSRYGDNGTPNTFLSRYEVKITPSNNVSGNICVLEIQDQNGKRVQPEKDAASEFVLTGDWTLKHEDCQYFSQGGAQGSLRFYSIGMPGEVFQILFRENENGGKALIRIKGEPKVEVDLYNEQEGNELISLQLQPSRLERFLWNMLGTAGWVSIIIALLMMFTLLVKNIRHSQRIPVLFAGMEKHPWIGIVPTTIGVVIFIELFLFNPGFVNSEFLKLEERHYSVTDGVLSQFNPANGKLTAQTNDPNITFNNINLPVSAISIECAHSVPAVTGQFFYSRNGEAFNETDSITYDASVSETTLLLKQGLGIAQPVIVSDLRFDLTDAPGDIISCDEFIINPYIPFKLTGMRLASYAGFLLLVLLSALVEKYPWVSLIPIAIGVAIMFWPSGAYTSPDVAYYLSLAKNLYHGNGYVNPDLSPNIYRGPVFPLLISLSYLLFGEAFRSAVIMERIFWVLTVFVSYILGRQLFNQRVGFLASTFVLSTVAINTVFYYVWTDGPLVVVILALQWLFWDIFRKQPGYKWYILLGALMGTAYLLKQTAIFIAPLPLLTWIVFSEYRTRQTLKKLLIYYSVFALFFFGWMGYVYLAGGSPKQVAGDLNIGLSIVSRFGSILKPSSQTTSSFSYSISLPEILTTYYKRDIVIFFKIAPIILLAIGFTVFQAVAKKSKPDIYLSMGLLLFSSLIPIQVVADFGKRQNLYFFIIGMICIAALIERLFNKVSSKPISNAVILTVALSLVSVQVSGENYTRLSSPITNHETLNYFSNYQTTADWVNKYVKPDEKILIQERDGNILHILTTGNRTFEIINTCRGEISFWPAVACTPPYISFWIYNGTINPDDPRDVLSGISEPSLLSTIREKNVKYIFVTPRIYSLYFYLKIHPGFEEVAILENLAIFRIIHPVQPISTYPNINWETCVGKGTPEYLKNLEETKPARYEARLRDEITPWMGLSGQNIKTFQNWQGCQFETAFPGYHLP